jgi:hypothetical protein
MIKPRTMRWVRHAACMAENRSVCRVFVGKPEGNRSLGTSTNRWKNINKIHLRETGGAGVDWIHLAQDRDK